MFIEHLLFTLCVYTGFMLNAFYIQYFIQSLKYPYKICTIIIIIDEETEA